MSFFIHDDAVKALRFLHPELQNGVHYTVFMGVERDGTPASDAWIELWASDVPQPSIEALKQVYADNNLAAVSLHTGQPIVSGTQTL